MVAGSHNNENVATTNTRSPTVKEEAVAEDTNVAEDYVAMYDARERQLEVRVLRILSVWYP